jgi:pSer/pThr/pTyr-binding forkhead associated (FHA) protein
LPRLVIEILPPHPKAGSKTFDEFPVTIGRNPECRLAFDPERDRATSWKHAQITHSATGWVLTDAGSTNGTFVNGSRVTTTLLKDGDRVELGQGGPQIRVRVETPHKIGDATAKTMIATSGLPTIHLRLVGGAKGHAPVDRDFPQQVITFGRDPQSDISFAEPPHPVVSRNHAEIVLRGGEYHAVDKNATNGTLVNDRKIQSVALKDGDRLTLGEGGPVFEVLLAGKVRAEAPSRARKALIPIAIGLLIVAAASWLWMGGDSNTASVPAEYLSEQKFIEQAVIDFAASMNNKISSVPESLTRKIQQYIQSSLMRGEKAAFVQKLQRAHELMPAVQRILREHNLPPDLAYIAFQESRFDPTARSHVGAAGLWQFMVPTARQYGLEINDVRDDRLDPELSTHAAARYVLDLHAELGDYMLVLAAYNFGPGNVRKALRKIEDPTRNRDYWYLVKKDLLPKETDEYVYKIISGWIVATHPDRFGFPAELATQRNEAS